MLPVEPGLCGFVVCSGTRLCGAGYWAVACYVGSIVMRIVEDLWSSGFVAGIGQAALCHIVRFVNTVAHHLNHQKVANLRHCTHSSGLREDRDGEEGLRSAGPKRGPSTDSP